MGDISHLLDAADRGDPHATSQLLPLVYDELRKLAAQKLAHERPGQTFHATALVHEPYLRLVAPAKSAEAEPLLVSGYEGVKQREAQLPAAHKVRLTEAVERLVQFYEATGKPEKAAEYRAQLPPKDAM
jgi:hypothetical protein